MQQATEFTDLSAKFIIQLDIDFKTSKYTSPCRAVPCVVLSVLVGHYSPHQLSFCDALISVHLSETSPSSNLPMTSHIHWC
jgi:hypothetical protein